MLSLGLATKTTVNVRINVQSFLSHMFNKLIKQLQELIFYVYFIQIIYFDTKNSRVKSQYK